jgi:hypothetical protein
MSSLHNVSYENLSNGQDKEVALAFKRHYVGKRGTCISQEAVVIFLYGLEAL